MVWQPSPYSTDPYIGQALTELARLFQPPDAKEMLAYGQLGALQSEQERIQEAGDAARRLLGNDGGALAAGYGLNGVPETLLYGDAMRMGPGADLHSLDPRVYAVFGNAGNTAWGIDEKNQTDLAGHYIDAQNALDVQALENQGAFDRARDEPISVSKDGVVYLNPDRAADQGVPTALLGNLYADQGQTIYGADGGVYRGDPKPLTTDQLTAQIIANMAPGLQDQFALAGQGVVNLLDDEGNPVVEPRASAVGGTPVLQDSDVTDALGTDGAPVITTNTEAVQSGMAPAPTGSDLSAVEKAARAAGLTPGTQAYVDFITKSSLGQPNIAPFGRKQFEDLYQGILERSGTSQDLLGMYDIAAQALGSGTYTGAGGETLLGLQKLGQSLGFNVDPQQIAGGEMLQALQNRLALLARNPESGMGMPGAVSDRDIEFLKSMQPGLTQSAEGNRILLEAYRRIAERNVQLGQLANDYLQQHGEIDAGFYQTVAQYAAVNPLFADLMAPATPAPAAPAPAAPTGGAFSGGVWGSQPPADPGPPLINGINPGTVIEEWVRGADGRLVPK